MKKFLSLVLIFSMLLTLTACGKSAKAKELSQEVYENLEDAYKIIDNFAADYLAANEAGTTGTSSCDEISAMGSSALANYVSLSYAEIREAAAVYNAENWYDTYDNLSESDKEYYKELAEENYQWWDPYLYWYTIYIVQIAYDRNGQIEKAEKYLKEANSGLKELKSDYKDSDYYDDLKKYYSTADELLTYLQNRDNVYYDFADQIASYQKKIKKLQNSLEELE